MITLRRLQPSDASLLSRIGTVSVLESHGHSAPEGVMKAYADKTFSLEACLDELSDHKNIFYGACYNKEPAGYSKIILNLPTPKIPLQPITKMERLYLLKQFYGLQLADHLVTKAKEVSRNGGDKGMWLNVWKGNPRAIHFYQKQRFKIVGEYDFVVTPTHTNPNWVMFLEFD